MSDTSAGSFNTPIIEEFRAGKGKVGGMFEGASLLLLTTIGARSGQPHTTPVVYLRDADRLLIFGTNAGAGSHPAWFHNLRANPAVTVEIGTEAGIDTYPAAAQVLDGAERDRWYARQSELDPAFAAYQDGTSRVIPVIALQRTRRAPIGRRGVMLGALIAATAAGASVAVISSGGGAVPKEQAVQRTAAIGDHLRTVHAQLRRDLVTVRAGLDRLSSATNGTETISLPADLRAHCVSFCGAMHEHHTNEDGVFPALARLHPELAPVVQRLQAEHGVVARVLTELQALLDAAEGSDITRLRAEFDRLAGELETHFSYEEETLVDTLNATDPASLRQP